jgi:hypothetical protein
MPRAVSIIALLMVLAGAAAAQAPPATPANVPGVTVTGKRLVLKPCSERDKACIAAVIAELKARYPDQLASWCSTQDLVVMKKNLNPEMFTSDNLPALSGQFDAPGATKQACASDAKPAKK